MDKRDEWVPVQSLTRPDVTECRLDMVDQTQIVIDADTPAFSALGGRIAIGDIPKWLERGWVEIETTWETFGEREPWQDDNEVVVVAQNRARMRIYRHAVVTASLVYEEDGI